MGGKYCKQSMSDSVNYDWVIKFQNADLDSPYLTAGVNVSYGLQSCEENIVSLNGFPSSHQIHGIDYITYLGEEVTFCVMFVDGNCRSDTTTTVICKFMNANKLGEY